MLVEPVLLCSFARRIFILDDGGGMVRGDTLIAIPLLVYIVSAWGVYAILTSWLRTGRILRPKVASMILLAWLVVAPYGLRFLLAPLVNQVFMACPALQTRHWGMGLGLGLWLGMMLSYPVGLLVGIWGVRCFFKTKSDDEAVEHAH